MWEAAARRPPSSLVNGMPHHHKGTLIAACALGQGQLALAVSPSPAAIAGLLELGSRGWLENLPGDLVEAACGAAVPTHRTLGDPARVAAVPDALADRDVLEAWLDVHPDLPRVLWSQRQEDRFEVVAFVQPGLRVFRGHFPAHPVVPGALLLNWVGQWIREPGGEQRPLLELAQCKFSRIVEPEAVIRLEGRVGERATRFSVTSRDGTHCSGEFRFREH